MNNVIASKCQSINVLYNYADFFDSFDVSTIVLLKELLYEFCG